MNSGEVERSLLVKRSLSVDRSLIAERSLLVERSPLAKRSPLELEASRRTHKFSSEAQRGACVFESTGQLIQLSRSLRNESERPLSEGAFCQWSYRYFLAATVCGFHTVEYACYFPVAFLLLIELLTTRKLRDSRNETSAAEFNSVSCTVF